MKNSLVVAHLRRAFSFTSALAAGLLLVACASNAPAPVYTAGGQATAASALPEDSYVVKPGDTIYSIAREHNLDFRELIALNAIESPDRIAVGSVLKIKPPTPPVDQTVASTSPISTDVVVAMPIGDLPPNADPSMTGNTANYKREPLAGKVPYSDEALAQAENPTTLPEIKTDDVTPEAKPAEPTPAPALTGDELAWIWPANGKTIGTFSDAGSKGVDIAGKAGDPVIASSDGKVVYSGTGLRGYGKLVIIKHNNTYLSAYAHNQNILVKEGQSVIKGQKIAEMGNTDADQVKLHFEVRRQGKPVDPLKYLPPR